MVEIQKLCFSEDCDLIRDHEKHFLIVSIERVMPAVNHKTEDFFENHLSGNSASKVTEM